MNEKPKLATSNNFFERKTHLQLVAVNQAMYGLNV